MTDTTSVTSRIGDEMARKVSDALDRFTQQLQPDKLAVKPGLPPEQKDETHAQLDVGKRGWIA